ncbi:hypothetical protein RvY_05654-2 [Ramazzottius varieornatus]|uniref:RRM domain-containing protein n=1 Tax=Ramazzottius varieornatus TaxID=947166 RepID=A0A1D1V2F7_RAMVA|nr:hypothetical protein RvY_05654-2 [Ramazzottius varieornatus]
MNQRDKGTVDMAAGNFHLPNGRGLGGGVWLCVQGLPRDWREMDVFRAMEKRYGKVNQVRRGSSSDREAMVQFVSDTDAKFVWQAGEIELYDRVCTVEVAQTAGRGARGRMDDSPPPMRSAFPSRMGSGMRDMGMRDVGMRDPVDRGGSMNRMGSVSNGNGTNGQEQTHLAPEDDDKATRTLFVGNLEYGVTESLLRSIFSKYGMVQDIDIKRPGGSSGNAYSFVRFLTLDMAYRAKVALSGSRIGNYQCKIGYGKTNPTARVWVGGLHYAGVASDLDESRLNDEFDRFGLIKKIDYVRGEHYGYITFASISASQEAVTTMRGAVFKINGDRGPKKVRIRVDYAEDSDPYLPKLGGREREGSTSARRRGGDDVSRGSGEADRRRKVASTSRSPSPAIREVKRRQRSVDAESEPEERPPKRIVRDESVTPPPEERREKRNGDKTKTRSRPAETLTQFKEKSSPVWKGTITLKSTSYHIAGHLLRGPIAWLNDVLSQGQELQITRRLRLEEDKLKDVTDKMSMSESATMLCFDAPTKAAGTKTLKHLQSYLLEKDAAGVINAQQAIVYIFPTCGFANKIVGEDMPTLIMPDNGTTVRDEELGCLMVICNPQEGNGALAE